MAYKAIAMAASPARPIISSREETLIDRVGKIYLHQAKDHIEHIDGRHRGE
jgi:hypothetical protein